MMTNNNNNLPVYEEQQFIQEQKTEQIEEMLNRFKQSIPSDFVKLEEGNYCGPTNSKWNNKPLSERYFFTYEGKEYQIDIPHMLMEKLELEKGEDITQPFYLDPKVLERKETYRGITVNEGEIFIQKPFTIQNLEQELNKWLIEIKCLKNDRDDYQNKWDSSVEELEQKREIIRSYLLKIRGLEEEKERLNADLQTTGTELTAINTLITNLQVLLRTNDLNSLPQIPEGETLTTLLARPTPASLQAEQNRANDLEERNNILQQEKRDIQTQRDNRPNITLNQWNNDYSRRPTQQQFNNIQQEKTNLQTQLNNTRNELNNTSRERDDYRNQLNNHTCPSYSNSSNSYSQPTYSQSSYSNYSDDDIHLPFCEGCGYPYSFSVREGCPGCRAEE